MSQNSSRVFSDHSIVFEPCFAPWFLRIPKNALYRRERKTLLEYSMLPHLTVAWTVPHETNQSQLVPRFRTNVNYTPHSICLHAVHNKHFTWDFRSSVVSRRRFFTDVSDNLSASHSRFKHFKFFLDCWNVGKKINVYLPSLRMKVPDHLYVFGSLLLQ
jgi:hypothetical protein